MTGLGTWFGIGISNVPDPPLSDFLTIGVWDEMNGLSNYLIIIAILIIGMNFA